MIPILPPGLWWTPVEIFTVSSRYLCVCVCVCVCVALEFQEGQGDECPDHNSPAPMGPALQFLLHFDVWTLEEKGSSYEE